MEMLRLQTQLAQREVAAKSPLFIHQKVHDLSRLSQNGCIELSPIYLYEHCVVVQAIEDDGVEAEVDYFSQPAASRCNHTARCCVFFGSLHSNNMVSLDRYTHI